MNTNIIVATILIECCVYFLSYASMIGNNTMMSNRHRPRIVHYGSKIKKIRRGK